MLKGRGVLQFSVDGITDTVRQFVSAQNDRSGPFLNDLLHEASSDHAKIDSLAYSLLSVVATTAAAYSAALAQIVDYYLDDARKSEHERLMSLSSTHDAVANETIVTLMHEAMRKSAAFCHQNNKINCECRPLPSGFCGLSHGKGQRSSRRARYSSEYPRLGQPRRCKCRCECFI